MTGSQVSNGMLFVSSRKNWRCWANSGDVINVHEVEFRETIVQQTDFQQTDIYSKELNRAEIRSLLPESLTHGGHAKVNLVILLDSADCWCAFVPESAGKLGLMELAFQLEEQLPIDAEDMAIIRSSPNGIYVVTRKTILQSLVTRLKTERATVHAIIPQVLFVAEAFRKTADVSRVLIQQGDERNELEFNRGQLVAWDLFFEQGFTASESGRKKPEDFDWCYSNAADLFDSESQDKDRQEIQQKNSTLTLFDFAERIVKGKTRSRFSFLPGLREEFEGMVDSRTAILIGLVLVFLIFLNSCLWVGRIRYAVIADSAVQRQTAIFRSVFPKRRRIVEVEKQLNVHLQNQRSYSAAIESAECHAGVSVMVELLNSLSNPNLRSSDPRLGVTNLGVEKIRVGREEVVLEGTCPDSETVESFRSKLRALPNLGSSYQFESETRRYVLTLRYSGLGALHNKVAE